MEYERYIAYSRLKEREFEEICARCGECCGSLDDPCEYLSMDDNGKYFCRVYEDRFGPKKTLSGKHFNCVSIRAHIGAGSLRPSCAYRHVR